MAISKHLDIVGKSYPNYTVISYEGKNSSGVHTYKIRFNDTKNIYTRTRPSVLKGTLVDAKQKKRVTKSKAVAVTRKKGSSTYSCSENPILGYVDKKDNILVLDQSSNATGFCVIKNQEISDYGKIQEKNKNSYLRIKDLISDIEILRAKHEIKAIILEDIYLGYSPTTYRKLSEVIGAIAFYATVKNLSVILVPNGLWTGRLGINGKREQLKLKSVQMALKITGNEIKSDDVSDAICIAEYFLVSRNINKTDNVQLSWE